MKILVKSFVAGFISVLVFHQGMLGILNLAGVTPRRPYAMIPTQPFHLPFVLSQAFWGGVWGVVLWLLIRRLSGARYWLAALAIGAVAPTFFALLVVFPLKGQPVGGGWVPAFILGALLVNAAWGLGVALFMGTRGLADRQGEALPRYDGPAAQ